MVWPAIIGAGLGVVGRKLAQKAATEAIKQTEKAALKQAGKEAREEAIKGATSRMEGGVKVTEYPPVKNVKPDVTAAENWGASRGARTEDMTRRLSDEDFYYKKGGKVSSKKGVKVRGCGIAERGLTKGKMR